jgi:glutamine amidotransferase
MDAEAVIAHFVRLRSKHRRGPALFHSRWSTGGVIGKSNCHPFRIGGDRRTVLAHNGVFPDSAQPQPGDKRSDTRILAEDLLRGTDLGNPAVRKLIQDWMGSRNKVVLLTVNPNYDHRSYLLNEDRGVWHEDIWYSNHDFEGYSRWVDPHARGGSSLRRAVNTTPQLRLAVYSCPKCHGYDNIDFETSQCLACAFCLDCENDLSACLCWTPSITTQPA